MLDIVVHNGINDLKIVYYSKVYSKCLRLWLMWIYTLKTFIPENPRINVKILSENDWNKMFIM